MSKIIRMMNDLAYLFYICVDWRFPFLLIEWFLFLRSEAGIFLACSLVELYFIGFDVLEYFVRLLCWLCCLLLFCIFFHRFGICFIFGFLIAFNLLSNCYGNCFVFSWRFQFDYWIYFLFHLCFFRLMESLYFNHCCLLRLGYLFYLFWLILINFIMVCNLLIY